jgi:hypothetical protein
LSEQIAIPLSAGRLLRLRCIIFSTPDYLRLELFLSLCLSLPSQGLGFSSSHRSLLSDPTIRVYLSHTAITTLTPIQSPRRPYFHHSSRFTFLHPFRFNTTLRTYPENSTCLILSHAQVIQYLSFPPTPTIFIHSDPNPEKAVLKEKSLPFPVFRRLFVAWPHRSCPRSPRHALRPGGVHGLYYILRSSSLPFRASIPRRNPYLDLLLFIKWTTYFSPHCLSR